MINFFKTSAVAAGVLCLAAVSAPASASAVFDSFDVSSDQSAADTTTTGATGVFSAQTTGGIIFGGYREVYANKAGNTDSSARVFTSVDAGRANFSSDTNAFGYGIIRWDGIAQTGMATRLTGVPAYGASQTTTLGNLISFGSGFQVTYNSDASFDIDILVYTATGIFSAGQPVSDTNNLDVTDTVYFGEFNLVSGTGTIADFTDTRAVEVVFNGLLGNIGRLDMNFAPPRGIPEPASLALVGMALLGLGAARRRKA